MLNSLRYCHQEMFLYVYSILKNSDIEYMHLCIWPFVSQKERAKLSMTFASSKRPWGHTYTSLFSQHDSFLLSFHKILQ